MAIKKYHHGDLKNALIQAGLDILEEKGLSGLTLRACAARVGVSHTAPKNHFGSLTGLVTAIGAEGFRRHTAAMQAGLSDFPSRKDRLLAALSGYVRFAQAHPALYTLMFSPVHADYSDPDLTAASRASYAVLEEISRGLLWSKADLPNAQIRTEMMLWSFVHGYAQLAINNRFRPCKPEDDTPFSILEVIPEFSYRNG